MEQCLKCELFFDNISSRGYYDKTPIIMYDDKMFRAKERYYCYDCLKENDLLYKCCKCDQVKELLSYMEKKTIRVRKEGYYLGFIKLNVLKNDNFTDCICDKEVKHGMYCLDCVEQMTYIEIDLDRKYDVSPSDITNFKHLGYSFKCNEELIQTGKSLMQAGPSGDIYRIKIEKCKRRKWKKIPKGKEKEKQLKLRELIY